jgi:hypothetical protein
MVVGEGVRIVSPGDTEWLRKARALRVFTSTPNPPLIFYPFSASISFISFVLGNVNLIGRVGQLLRVGCNYTHTHTHTKYREWNIK